MPKGKRFEESPGLFGRKSSESESFESYCELCSSTYNAGADPDEPNSEGYDVRFERFAGLSVCEHCFDRIETAVLSRMGDIIPWWRRYLAFNRKQLEKFESDLANLPESGREIDLE